MIILHLKYRIQTGIHAGALKMGFVDKTGYYIMPQVFMGAMINRMTRIFYSCPEPRDFSAVGDFVYQHIKFTPFYVNDGTETYCPDDLTPGGKRKWGLNEATQIGSDEFEHRFIRSYTGTSVAYDVRSARKHTLHETEYIASRDRNGKALFLEGYAILFPGEHQVSNGSTQRTFVLSKDLSCSVTQGEDSGHLFNKLGASLQVGGDRNYGMGLISHEPSEPATDSLFGVVHIETDTDDYLRVTIESGKAICLPIKHDPQCQALTGMRGTLSPFIQREYSYSGGKGFGQHLTNRLFWEPGAYFTTEQNKIKMKIDDRGFWEIVS